MTIAHSPEYSEGNYLGSVFHLSCRVTYSILVGSLSSRILKNYGFFLYETVSGHYSMVFNSVSVGQIN